MYNFYGIDMRPVTLDFGDLEDRMLGLYAAKQRTKEKGMITTDPVGTIYRHKQSGRPVIKYTADGDPKGVIWTLDALGGTLGGSTEEFRHADDMTLATVEKLNKQLREYLTGRLTTGQTGKSDGSTADYYQLPKGATQLQDLISHRNMNAQLGEIFRAAYRFGMASHSDQLRDAKKIKFYIEAEIKRLEQLK
jgi:hypothetical protein